MQLGQPQPELPDRSLVLVKKWFNVDFHGYV